MIKKHIITVILMSYILFSHIIDQPMLGQNLRIFNGIKNLPFSIATPMNEYIQCAGILYYGTKKAYLAFSDCIGLL